MCSLWKVRGGPNSVLMRHETIIKTGKVDPGDRVTLPIACEQTLLFGRAKRVSRERARERQSREGPLARAFS